ncbi:polycomb group protein Psc-like [Euwallacea similis]|uniref:polycomb group protein Psc-like n=1 Tax=Euwallacea similis TaxID=1736056 RepID=UPI00344FBC88
MELPATKQEKIKLTEINQYLTCYLCKGYLIDATTISECLHSFCRSCIIKFLQDNSYCPVCELIINKAKPNLKLDKTLQDIVYKLVPELFLREMVRRKEFYRDHPQIAGKVSPEGRGEDTERTIFNPQEMISLSMEYIRDDSTPGAIRIPGIATDPETLKNNGTIDESPDSQMKRYLLCPGMCRVEVLKKFVRNKYNVDTNQFFIDVLYKRVPLPDHYTLIDIAYIYSWQRNELMKFFFRIIDKNKARSPDDTPLNNIPQFIPRHFRKCKSERIRREKDDKKSARRSVGKFSQKVASEPEIPTFDLKPSKNIKSEADDEENNEKVNRVKEDSALASPDAAEEPLDTKTAVKEEKCKEINTDEDGGVIKREENLQDLTVKPELTIKTEHQVEPKLVLKLSKEFLDKIPTSKPQQMFSKPITKSYTSITLNRSENVEIITKIEPVSNKDGTPIGHHIIKQTIKKGSKMKSPKKISKSPVTIPRLVINKKNLKKKSVSPKRELSTSLAQTETKLNIKEEVEDEKLKFFNYIKLLPKATACIEKVKKSEDKVEEQSKKQMIISKPVGKRKNPSPLKNEKAKVPKTETKKVKIILYEKPLPSPPLTKQDSGLQSLISACKIPSSLSITIKEGSEKDSVTPQIVPPVKNYIEILKLPEEGEASKPKLDLSKFCDNDSEQQVDEDLSEIARSLTEKIPMSTTVSQIVGPKPQFQIPVKTNISPKAQIQPSPVPELSKALTSAKLSPRSPQTFQRIFEESLRKPPEKTESPDSNVPSTNKRNILEIASQLFKKTKLKQDQDNRDASPTPKVAIPRLPNPRSPKVQSLQKLVPQTVASLHSTSLGMNYTVSVGQQSPSKTMKSNGIISPVKADSVPSSVSPLNELKPSKGDFKVPSPSLGSPKLPEVPNSSPKTPSPKHSPKSSPLVKHMYSPSPTTRLPPKPLKSSPPLVNSTSPTSSSALSPNEILEKYNIQNLAQLTANFNPSILATNQFAALQQAMLLKHFEIQKRQNWLNLNQGPLLQYEKYLQGLNGGINGSHSQS